MRTARARRICDHYAPMQNRVARTVLKLAAGSVVHPGTNMTWLERAPAMLPSGATCSASPTRWMPPSRSCFQRTHTRPSPDRTVRCQHGLRDQELCRLSGDGGPDPGAGTPPLSSEACLSCPRIRQGKRPRVVGAQRLRPGDSPGASRSTPPVCIPSSAAIPAGASNT